MKYNRDEAITETLKWEGGYSNDAGDPGGPTNYGITIADVRKYVKPGATAQDVKKLTKAQAIEVYRNKYWKTPYYDCDTLASGVDLSVFDFGVNSGPSRAKKYLDKSVGGSASDTITKYNDSRLAFLKGLGTWSIFGKGWGRRVVGIKAKSLEMASRKPEISKAKLGFFASLWAAALAGAHWLNVHKVSILVTAAAISVIAFAIYGLHKRRKANA